MLTGATALSTANFFPLAPGPRLKMPRWGRWVMAGAFLFLLLPSSLWILSGADYEEEGDEPVRSVTWLPESDRSLARRRRYAVNPLGYKWDHVNLTYKIEQFPSTLNRANTERAIARAFRMWSDVSPLSFRRIPSTQQADITIGFYTFNHTDCWFSPLHPCFDGLNGELAHAFLPPRGDIHFDNHEFWVLGRSHFSWKQGVWMNDLVQVAAHEIGHALGLWHSRDIRALMHPNATYSRTWRIGHDDVWAIQRLYGCVDEKQQCQPWARQGFCTRQRAFMLRHCPRICNACLASSSFAGISSAVVPSAAGAISPSPFPAEHHPSSPFASTPSVQPPFAHAKHVAKGRVVAFRCGPNSSSMPPLQVSWYKDGVPLAHALPGFKLLPNLELRVVATEVSEGCYTCLIRRGSRILRVHSWQIKLKGKSHLRTVPGLYKDQPCPRMLTNAPTEATS